MSLLGIRDISNLETPAARPQGDRDPHPPLRRRDDQAGDPPRAEPRRPGLLRPQPRLRHPEHRRPDPVDRPRGADRDRPRPDGGRGAREGRCSASSAASSTSWSPRRSSSRGLDIPNVNTIFINEADKYGLADLHQLRGRVGRYKHRAYAYLLLESDRPVTPNAVKRLKAIEEFTELGAGFKIALRDLEIRGAGNILGAEQSGHIESVGYELYCSLLESAVRALTQPARAAAVRLLDRAGLARLPAPRLRPRPAGQGRALPPAGPAPEPGTAGRLPPGADRPLRPPAPPGREPAGRGRAADPGRALAARADPRRGRVRRPDLPRSRADRGPGPPPSRAGPDRRREEGVCPARRGSRQGPRHRRAHPLPAANIRMIESRGSY